MVKKIMLCDGKMTDYLEPLKMDTPQWRDLNNSIAIIKHWKYNPELGHPVEDKQYLPTVKGRGVYFDASEVKQYDILLASVWKKDKVNGEWQGEYVNGKWKGKWTDGNWKYYIVTSINMNGYMTVKGGYANCRRAYDALREMKKYIREPKTVGTNGIEIKLNAKVAE